MLWFFTFWCLFVFSMGSLFSCDFNIWLYRVISLSSLFDYLWILWWLGLGFLIVINLRFRLCLLILLINNFLFFNNFNLILSNNFILLLAGWNLLSLIWLFAFLLWLRLSINQVLNLSFFGCVIMMSFRSNCYWNVLSFDLDFRNQILNDFSFCYFLQINFNIFFLMISFLSLRLFIFLMNLFFNGFFYILL